MDLYESDENQVLTMHERVLEGIRYARQETKELAKKLKTSDVIETNPDNDNDEGEIYQDFLKNKKKMDGNSFKSKSFVKKKKFVK